MNTDNITKKTVSLRNLTLNGWPVANNRLAEYADKLTVDQREDLTARMVRGERFAVFNIDGDVVSLASEPEMEMVPA